MESAGANLLYQSEVFIDGGRVFANLARLSAAGIPVFTVVHGSSTAGGAYLPGLSDYVVVVRGQAKIFLAGPPLVKAALGEDADEETLGGGEMHATVTGSAEYAAADDAEALEHPARAGRPRLPWQPPAPPAARLARRRATTRTSWPARCRSTTAAPYDCREVIARLVDGSDFLELEAALRQRTRCAATPRSDGLPIGLIGNNGPIDNQGATKAAQFIQLCCQSGCRSSTCRTPPATWSAGAPSRRRSSNTARR